MFEDMNVYSEKSDKNNFMLNGANRVMWLAAVSVINRTTVLLREAMTNLYSAGPLS